MVIVQLTESPSFKLPVVNEGPTSPVATPFISHDKLAEVLPLAVAVNVADSPQQILVLGAVIFIIGWIKG